MSERDEMRRLQRLRDQLDQSCLINFAEARGAIDDALKYMRKEARADLAAERIAELEARERELVAALWHLHHNARTSGAEMGLALDAVEVVLAKIDAQQQETK